MSPIKHGKVVPHSAKQVINYSGKVVRLSRELISTLKNHMQVIVILLMQSGTTLHELISPYDTIMTPPVLRNDV